MVCTKTSTPKSIPPTTSTTTKAFTSPPTRKTTTSMGGTISGHSVQKAAQMVLAVCTGLAKDNPLCSKINQDPRLVYPTATPDSTVSKLVDPCTGNSGEGAACNNWKSFRDLSFTPFVNDMLTKGGLGKFTSDLLPGSVFTHQSLDAWKEDLDRPEGKQELDGDASRSIMLRALFSNLGQTRALREETAITATNNHSFHVTAGVSSAAILLLYCILGLKKFWQCCKSRSARQREVENHQLYEDLRKFQAETSNLPAIRN